MVGDGQLMKDFVSAHIVSTLPKAWQGPAITTFAHFCCVHLRKHRQHDPHFTPWKPAQFAPCGTGNLALTGEGGGGAPRLRRWRRLAAAAVQS